MRLRSAALFSLALPLGCASPPTDTPDSPPPKACEYRTQPEKTPVSQPIVEGPVFAGAASSRLDFPVGTPLGGYTARMKALGGQARDARRSPHAKAFAPSAGIQTVPMLRALVLAAGDQTVVFVKADLCVAYDRLVFDLEQVLSQAGIPDAQVIFLTSHTHAGPGTFQGTFHLSLGFDLFQEEQYARLLKTATEVVLAAHKAKQPAKLGASIWDGWDRADDIYSDRRKEDDGFPGPDGKPVGKHKEQRLLLFRVDNAADEPLAVLASFPIHGTVGGSDNPLFSTDATGHIELALEERFSRPVLAMHWQGPAGDISPRGVSGLSTCDQPICEDFARMESIGERAAPRILDLWQATKTKSSAALEVVTRSVRNGRDITVRGAMSYAPYDPQRPFDASTIYEPGGNVRSPLLQFNVPVGAGLCGEKRTVLPVDGIPGATGVPYASCAELSAAQKFVSAILKVPEPRLPSCEATRTTLSAVRWSGLPLHVRVSPISGGPTEDQLPSETLLLATLPGEPVTLLADALRQKSPAGTDRTFVIGYAQGHVGYLLGVENWLRGGYEASINIFGPLEGEWLVERSLDLLKLAMTAQKDDPGATAEGAPTPGARFDRLVYEKGAWAHVPIAVSSQAGQVPAELPPVLFVRAGRPKSAQPDAEIKRVWGRAQFVFHGGDPEEDTPQVVLQTETAPGTYTPVLSPSGRPLGVAGRDVLLTYTPVPVDAPPGKATAHLWSVEWQAVGFSRLDKPGVLSAFSVPLGRYRFAVAGKNGGQNYQVSSRPFAVVAEGALQLTANRTGARIQGRAVFPVGAGFRLLRLTGPSDGLVPPTGPLTVTFAAAGRQEKHTVTAPDGYFSFDTALPGGGPQELTVQDTAENRGHLAF